MSAPAANKKKYGGYSGQFIQQNFEQEYVKDEIILYTIKLQSNIFCTQYIYFFKAGWVLSYELIPSKY